MTISRLHRPFSSLVLAFSLLSLVACGGGGGKGGNNGPSSQAASVSSETLSLSSAGSSISSQVGTVSSASTLSASSHNSSDLGSASSQSQGDTNNSSISLNSSSASSVLVVIGNSSKAASSEAAHSSLPFSSSSASSIASDTSPNPFAFTASVDAELSALVTSDAVVITGIDALTPISITGGEYALDGGAFTSAAGMVGNGQSVVVRVTASASHSSTLKAQLTVGDQSAEFTVTTLADRVPDAFSFLPETNAELETLYSSNTITVTGIDAETPISILGGSYSINGGEFTSNAANVSLNDTVTVQGLSAAGNDLTQEVILTIGGVSATYSITTLADAIPPVATFNFPTPYTMSPDESVIVRGMATDFNGVAQVKLRVRAYHLNSPEETIATTEVDATPLEQDGIKDFSSWTASIPLTADAENEIKVIATDERGNTIALEDAKQVVIRQAHYKSGFPNEDLPFDRIYTIALDASQERLLLSDRGMLWAVSLLTGENVPFINHSAECNTDFFGMAVDSIDDRIYGVCDYNLVEFELSTGDYIATYPIPSPNYDVHRGIAIDRLNGNNELILIEDRYHTAPTGGQLLGFSLDSKEFRTIASGEMEPAIKSSQGIVAEDGFYWATGGGQTGDASLHKVFKINASTGEREVFSDNSIGSGEPFLAKAPWGSTILQGIIVDNKNNEIIVGEFPSQRLIAINKNTGDRRLLKQLTSPFYDMDFFFQTMPLNETDRYLLLVENNEKTIVVFDLDTQQFVYLTKGKYPY